MARSTTPSPRARSPNAHPAARRHRHRPRVLRAARRAPDVGDCFYADPRKAFGLFAGELAIASLGIFDDLEGANARTKFDVQFAVAGAMYALGYRIDLIANPFGPEIQLGVFGLPFTVLWIAGVTNALKFIDGSTGSRRNQFQPGHHLHGRHRVDVP